MGERFSAVLKLRVHPLFLLSLLLYTLFGGLLDYAVAFFAVILHEVGHLVIARIAGVKEMKISLMPYGATMRIEEEVGHLGAILLAGPIANLLFASLALSASWIFPEAFGFLKGFLRANVILATVNLLPAYPLDGGRLLRLIAKGRWARVFTLSFPIIPGSFAFVLFIENGNISLLLFSLFMLSYLGDNLCRSVNRRKSSDPLFTLMRTDDEGRILPARIKGTGKGVRLSPFNVTTLCLKYPREMAIEDALKKEKILRDVGYK